LPSAHLLIDQMGVHRVGVLFKHLQLALDPVLRAYGLAGPYVLLDSRNCHDFDVI